jgi:hypothetical protein
MSGRSFPLRSVALSAALALVVGATSGCDLRLTAPEPSDEIVERVARNDGIEWAFTTRIDQRFFGPEWTAQPADGFELVGGTPHLAMQACLADPSSRPGTEPEDRREAAQALAADADIDVSLPSDVWVEATASHAVSLSIAAVDPAAAERLSAATIDPAFLTCVAEWVALPDTPVEVLATVAPPASSAATLAVTTTVRAQPARVNAKLFTFSGPQGIVLLYLAVPEGSTPIDEQSISAAVAADAAA